MTEVLEYQIAAIVFLSLIMGIIAYIKWERKR